MFDSVRPQDYSPPGCSVHGILQARILEWVAMPSSGGSSDPGIEPVFLMSPALAGRFSTTSSTWVTPLSLELYLISKLKKIFFPIKWNTFLIFCQCSHSYAYLYKKLRFLLPQILWIGESPY